MGHELVTEWLERSEFRIVTDKSGHTSNECGFPDGRGYSMVEYYQEPFIMRRP
jgi:hypothetical protein